MNRIDVGPSISIGICLPITCSVDHLEFIVNQVIQTKAINNVSVKILENSCQFGESASNSKDIDLATM